jgi:hypothetical protein
MKKLIIIAFAFYIPLQSMAWGMIGHRVVGEIADSYLSPSARKKVKQILGDESIAMASTWADFIKSDTNFRYLNKWHYADFPKHLSYEQVKDELKKDTGANAYNKLLFMMSELKNNKALTRDQKQFYLRLIIHIVGDLHQPLHVSAEGTAGGNDVKVMWFSEQSNLHRVWDEHLPEYQNLSYTEMTDAINHTSSKQRKELQQQPIEQWIYESYQISQQLHDDIRQPNPRLSYNYNFKWLDTMNSQLLKGGVHLAGLLNEIFK